MLAGTLLHRFGLHPYRLLLVKDSKQYADSGGWEYGQFENVVANQSEPLLKSCFASHTKLDCLKDLVFSHYSP
jgi:hypothetical protein